MPLNSNNKEKRYLRIADQIASLFPKCNDRRARMATVAALLYHKLDHHFWTGFYLLHDGELIVGPYQGPVACMVLEKNKGVCWHAIHARKTIIVPDVHLFPDHIACDSRSKSEIVVPLKDNEHHIIGVLDVDSNQLNAFDEIDAKALENITAMLFT